MLGGAKTKLPSLLLPAEWKVPAPFNLKQKDGCLCLRNLREVDAVPEVKANIWHNCSHLENDMIMTNTT